MILLRRCLSSCCAFYAEDLVLELADTEEGNDASSILSMLVQGGRILRKNPFTYCDSPCQHSAHLDHQDNRRSTLLCYLTMMRSHFLQRMKSSHLLFSPPDCPVTALLSA